MYSKAESFTASSNLSVIYLSVSEPSQRVCHIVFISPSTAFCAIFSCDVSSLETSSTVILSTVIYFLSVLVLSEKLKVFSAL